MDEAVWDASYYQDVYVSAEETGQQCEVLYDTGEEDILNEISCLQVLRILITNANTEMAQLEEDLVSLHCELVLADDAWYEKCASTLQQEIKSFDISIPKLKNSIEKGELEFDLEPAKGMHEMLKVLLRDDLPQENDKV
ncbi:uncharacterized protein LOC124927453 [Impatiens glandulifera]|uniref:uncharacterized protein LOC124927453 n=1 Tax=Impatiens glandulifera TaxID=253017 RepID=UPI001FB19B21|nr:uncharacterized protein LOC124927453 [Impatiens glandulifera]